MKLFLDTADTVEVDCYTRLGIIDGVTTNPTILSKMPGDWKARCKIIAEMVQGLPVSVEVTESEIRKMIEQAQEIAGWSANINVKIPVHGVDGGLDYLDVVHALESSGIRVNVTACMSAQQCMLAAMAGATYVSLFGGRVANMGHDPRVEIAKTRALLDCIPRLPINIKAKPQLIVGSVREAANVTEWFLAGADIVTVTPQLIETMVRHPYTTETVQQFLADGGKLR